MPFLKFKIISAFIFLFCCCTIAQAQIITTVVGTGVFGNTGDGGPAILATMKQPRKIAFDRAGNYYICDVNSCTIRKVNPGDTITNISGTDVCVNLSPMPTHIPAANAVLSQPYGVATDTLGNIYFPDAVNHIVRKIDTNGTMVTIAGDDTAGFNGDGGPALYARLSEPDDVATDKQGNIYIADKFNFRIRRIDASGIISTFAGTGVAGYSGDGGPATAAKIGSAFHVTTDNAGNVYIMDSGRVRKVNTLGIITTIAGTGTPGFSGDGGPATAAQVAVGITSDLVADDNETIYITDNNRVRKIDGAGIITTIAGTGVPGFSGDGGPALLAKLNVPTGIDMDISGNLYIVDWANKRVRKICLEDSTQINISQSPATLCAGDAVTYNSSVISPGPTPVYQWYKNNLPVGNNTATYTNPTPATGDVVYCIITNNHGCSAYSVDTSNTITTIVNPVLVPSVTISASPGTNVAQNQSVTFTATVTNGGPTPIYQWTKNNIDIPAATAQTYMTNTLSNNDIIACRVKSDDMCPGADTSNELTMQVTPTLLRNIAGTRSQCTVYPNPATETLNFDYSNCSNCTLTITDLEGKTLISKSFTAAEGHDKFILKGFANGTYMYKVSDKGHTIQTGTFMKK